MSQAKDFDIALGARLRLFRKRHNETQAEIGQVLGCSFQQIQKYERGDNRISAYRLALLLDHYNEGWDDLIPAHDCLPFSRRFANALAVFDEGRACLTPSDLR